MGWGYEWASLCSRLTRTRTHARAHTHQAGADKSGDGLLDWAEFQILYSNVRKGLYAGVIDLKETKEGGAAGTNGTPSVSGGEALDHDHSQATIPGLSTAVTVSLASFTYIVAGCAIMHSLESSSTPIDALYVAICAVVGIGSGDICPTSSASRRFMVFYMFVGMTMLLGVGFAILVQFLAAANDRAVNESRAAKTDLIRALSQGRQTSEQAPLSGFQGQGARSVRAITGPLGWLLGLVLVVGVLVVVLEDWALVDGVYFAATTAATVGNGDLVPSTQLGRAIACVYVPCLVGNQRPK